VVGVCNFVCGGLVNKKNTLNGMEGQEKLVSWIKVRK